MKSEKCFYNPGTSRLCPPTAAPRRAPLSFSSFHGAAPGTADPASTGSQTSLYLSAGRVMGEE